MGEAPSHPTSEPPQGPNRWAMPAGPPTAGEQPAYDPWATTAPGAPSGPAAPPPPPQPQWAPPAPPTAPTQSTSPYPAQYLPSTYQQATYPPPAYQPPTSAYPPVPPTVPPGRPPTGWPPAGAHPLPPHSPHHRKRPAMAGVALIALIAIVLGLTAGVAIDRALQDRQQRADATSPFSNPSTSNGNSNDPSNGSSPFGGFVDPSQPGNDPTAGTADCSTNPPSDDESAQIAAKVTPGVVNINTMLGYQQAAAAGTGMILSSDGLVLTNNHVIDSATVIRATVVGTGDTYEAKVLGTAKTLDVALIQLVDAKGLPTVKIDDSKVATCDPVVAAGNAGGRGGDPSVVSGVVTAIDKSITASDENGDNQETLHELIETNAPIQPGDSGGPLIDADGEVIGMNTAASATNQFQSVRSVGYAIPIANALDIVEQIKAGKDTDTIRIGLPGIMGVQLDPTSSGASVVGVASGLPAEKAGIGAGSTITAINGTTIDTSAAVGDLLERAKPGDKVTVDWTDATGQQHTSKLTLVEGPPD